MARLKFMIFALVVMGLLTHQLFHQEALLERRLLMEAALM